MTSRYCVVQFVPDVVANERINIGVIAYDELGNMRARFVDKWTRIRQFGRRDISFLKDFERQIKLSISPPALALGSDHVPPLTSDTIYRMASTWSNSIQITEPRVSTESVDELIEGVANMFLYKSAKVIREYRDRKQAAALTREVVRQAVTNIVGKTEAEHLVQTNREISGKFEPHPFDTVVGNGKPLFAVQALSFELPKASELETSARLLAWTIADVKNAHADLPIGVVALPPKPDMHNAKTLYERYRRIFAGMNAKVLDEQSTTEWTGSMLRQLGMVGQ
jgi:hypothetical protein